MMTHPPSEAITTAATRRIPWPSCALFALSFVNVPIACYLFIAALNTDAGGLTLGMMAMAIAIPSSMTFVMLALRQWRFANSPIAWCCIGMNMLLLGTSAVACIYGIVNRDGCALALFAAVGGVAVLSVAAIRSNPEWNTDVQSSS